MNNTITGAEFVRRLFSKSDRDRDLKNTIVTSQVHLNGDKLGKIKNLTVQGVVFNSIVMLDKCVEAESTCLFRECSFLEGVSFEFMKCDHFSFYHSSAIYIHFCLKSEFKSLHLRGLDVEDDLDLSGTTVRGMLRINEVKTPKFVIYRDNSTPDALQAERAETDDPVFAHQLHLAGIPVYVSTAIAKSMLTPSPVKNEREPAWAAGGGEGIQP